ncbi:MAG TPA: CotH kinase family protein [Opitutaceae bacterium]
MKIPLIRTLAGAFLLTGFTAVTPSGLAQGFPPPGDFGPPPGGGGFGGRGGGMQEPEIALVDKFDRDGDKVLNAEERKEARASLGAMGGGGRRRGPRGGMAAPAEPGIRLSPNDVKPAGDGSLYDPTVLRTYFIDFDTSDWESEMEAFKNTDVEIPARLTIDGKVYKDVGVSFRGASSFMTVPAGRKRSLNLSVDLVHGKQDVRGYRTLNLLNAHLDPTFLRSVLYYQIARAYIPAYQANHARVVINGENWGVYVNVQQFNKDFTEEFFDDDKGARWKVPGSPRGRGGLNYLGDDAAAYRSIYEIKSKDTPEAWAALIKLCRVLNQTKPEQLEAALSPLLDIDGALKFLAIENVLINSDGYWVRASDYNLYQAKDGRFHLIPHDANETMSAPQGPGSGGEGLELDPLVGLGDLSKPLLGKLLAVPALRTRYLGYVRDIARDWLDWNKLGPIATRYQALIDHEVEIDTRKLDTHENFTRGLTEDVLSQGMRGGSYLIGLKTFADQRRAYLLNYPEIRALAP